MDRKLNSRFHKLLAGTGLVDYKKQLVATFSGGRAVSSKELNDVEASNLCNYLQILLPPDPSDRMRKKVIHYARSMGWETENYTADMARINGWCIEYGYLKKPLNDHTYEELPALVTQMERVYLSFLKSL